MKESQVSPLLLHQAWNERKPRLCAQTSHWWGDERKAWTLPDIHSPRTLGWILIFLTDHSNNYIVARMEPMN